MPLWRNTNFILMWSSVAASGFGDRMIQLAALALLGAGAAGAEASSLQAAISFFFFLPYLAIAPVGGWLADSMPRKWLLLACDEGRAGVMLVAWLLAPLAGAAGLTMGLQAGLFALIAATGTLAAVFAPTRNATIPQLVPGAQLQRANAVILSIAVIASLIGFGAGGKLIEAGSARVGLAVGLGCYAVSGLFFAFLRVPGQWRGGQSPRAELARLFEAIGYVRRHRAALELVLLSMILWGAANVVFTAAAALAKHRYGLPADEVVPHFAYLCMALGGGMLGGALLVAAIDSRHESELVVTASLLLAGVCVVGLALTASYGAALALAFGVGVFGNAAMIAVLTLLQSICPDHTRGRVFGVNTVASTLISVLVNLAVWQLPHADALMPWVLGALGGALIVCGAVTLVRHLCQGPLDSPAQNTIWHGIRFFLFFWHRLRTSGAHHVPRTGPAILAPNHTTGLDPFLIQSVVPRRVYWVMFASYRFRILEPIWRVIDPVTLEENDVRKPLRRMVQCLRDGAALGLFPEGALQRAHRELQPFEPGVAMVAQRADAPIVPVWISGTPRRQNMLWHFLERSSARVVFGAPYRPDPATPRDEVLAELRRRMLALASTVEAGETGDQRRDENRRS